MAFTRPTLIELVTRAEADLVSRLQITSAVLRTALIRIIARAVAGLAHGLHGHIAWAARQIFISTADSENLDLHGSEYGLARKPAAYAFGNVTFTGTNGSVIPAQSRLSRADGIEYVTDAGVVISGGTATALARATQSGIASNAAAGVALQLVSPIAGVQSALVVAVGGIANGTELETDDAYRIRLLDRRRNPPHGGSDADYRRWASEVAGVTRVWVYPNYLSPSHVGVAFVLDGEIDIIPGVLKVAEVQAYLDDPTRKPVCSVNDVFAPTSVALNPTVSVSPDTPEARALVEAEIRDYLFRNAGPGVDLDVSELNAQISGTLVSPSSDVVLSFPDIHVLGAITWS